MDSKTRIKNFISQNFPEWEKVDYAEFDEKIDVKKDFSELYRIDNKEVILISYTNISITGTERPKPQLRVFLDELKKPFYFAKKHQLRFYLFSIFTKEDKYARGLDKFKPKEYIISIETNLDNEGARRDLRSIYDYANNNIKGRKFLKCTRSNYKAEINQASFIYIGSEDEPEKSFFENFINIFDSRPYQNSNNDGQKILEFTHFKLPLQKIYYGAPGTGKSNEIKKMTAEGGMFTKDCTFRTTFHPDCDYASFVGAYKPYWDKTIEKIVYGFRPQSFLKAYIKAWKNPTKQVALVVEEINRGNCAQIFGDIFQLLDREKYGLSKYPIECDMEMQELLKDEFANETKDFGAAITDDVYADSKDNINTYYSAHYENAFEKIRNGEILALPMNLSILATMNTSDQSLFPMDSAFKRRWEWIYEPIVEGTDKDGKPLEWKIEIDNTHFVDWWNFLQKINAVIYSMTSSEDKQLGYFFCQPDKEDGETISKNLFVGKVIFYLWNEIFKDYAFEHDVCKKENKSDTLYFADFYEGKNVIKQASLEIFFNHLDENQPKIDDKDVKLIEEKIADTPKTDGLTDGANKGEQSSEEANPIQNEETTTENTEA